MKSITFRSVLGTTAALVALLWGTAATAQAPLSLGSARITIAGTSNVHDYTATTATARVTRVELGDVTPGATFWDDVQKSTGLKAFDITIPAETLKSGKDGLDKNMYKALKTKEHADITFRLTKLEGAAGALKATGILKIAGVEREVVLPLKTTKKGTQLAVTGELAVLMTDYGIQPPKAMMGMVKADPKVTVTFDVVLAIATT